MAQGNIPVRLFTSTYVLLHIAVPISTVFWWPSLKDSSEFTKEEVQFCIQSKLLFVYANKSVLLKQKYPSSKSVHAKFQPDVPKSQLHKFEALHVNTSRTMATQRTRGNCCGSTGIARYNIKIGETCKIHSFNFPTKKEKRHAALKLSSLNVQNELQLHYRNRTVYSKTSLLRTPCYISVQCNWDTHPKC